MENWIFMAEFLLDEPKRLYKTYKFLEIFFVGLCQSFTHFYLKFQYFMSMEEEQNGKN